MTFADVTFSFSQKKSWGEAHVGSMPKRVVRTFERCSELLRKLVERYPRLQSRIDESVAVSVNGEIYQGNLDLAIPEGADCRGYRVGSRSTLPATLIVR